MKVTLDYPPIWLLGCFALTWSTKDHFPAFGASNLPIVLGGAVFLGGLALALSAIITMTRAKTTVVPHETPKNLVISGPFRFSRNPIYLADVFTLVGFSVVCRSWLGLCLVPIFMIVIERRFIRHEEERLKLVFGETFEVWAAKTRRWL